MPERTAQAFPEPLYSVYILNLLKLSLYGIYMSEQKERVPLVWDPFVAYLAPDWAHLWPPVAQQPLKREASAQRHQHFAEP